ncbi:hypothetical protein BD413DRAFT_505582 [Trametes elegans]|nr:hypothetical protein BD413DRAFT_505582 [Trametes elegans]
MAERLRRTSTVRRPLYPWPLSYHPYSRSCPCGRTVQNGDSSPLFSAARSAPYPSHRHVDVARVSQAYVMSVICGAWRGCGLGRACFAWRACVCSVEGSSSVWMSRLQCRRFQTRLCLCWRASQSQCGYAGEGVPFGGVRLPPPQR